MKLGVLGPLTIGDTEVSPLVTAPKPRGVLAMLMLDANRAVSTTSLIEELWRENPPRSASTTLQTYILQLRKMFETLRPAEMGREVLVTRLPGYLLRADPDGLDLYRYERLVAQGQQLLTCRAYAQASEVFTQALALWRGEPLADVRPGPLLELHIRRLEESRLVVSELRIEAELQLGRHQEVLSELTHLVGQHPMHEGFRAKQMLALFRAGRLPAALDSFQNFRTILVGDLGLEPSVRLRKLHHAILSGTAETVSIGH